MAQTTYRSRQAITMQMRDAAYDRLGSLIRQLKHFNLNLLSIALVTNNFVEVVVNNPLPDSKVEQFALDVV